MGGAFPPTNGVIVYINGTPQTIHWLYRAGVFQYSDAGAHVTGTTYRDVWVSDIGSAATTGTTYRNGSLLSGPVSGPAGVPGTFANDSWIVGSTGGGNFLQGVVARILAWDRILTPTEIAQLDTGLKSFFTLI
jgi:hypothetical protein